MRTNSVSLALASVVACSVITLGASSASAASMNHVTAASNFLGNASVNDTSITNGCSITWTSPYVGHTKGACFFIEVLKHGNGYASDYTSTDIFNLWGQGSPTSHQLYTKIAASPVVGGTAPSPETYFRKVTNVTSIQSGDVIVIDSVTTSPTYAGHAMIATGPATLINPQYTPLWSGTLQWAVPIVDSISGSASSPARHGCNTAYPDSRWSGNCTTGFSTLSSTNGGAGTGYMRIYTDFLTGQMLGYTWSISNGDHVDYYSPSERQYLIGRLTNLPAPAGPPDPPPPPPPVGTPI